MAWFPTADPAGLTAEANGGQEAADAIIATLDSIPALGAPVRLDEVDLDDFDAVFYPGGHGPMQDLAVDAVSEPVSGRFGWGRVAGLETEEGFW